MAALRRSATIPSVHSNWTDSTPPAATISLHFVAKPAMKRMYKQQARSFIEQQRDSPLVAGGDVLEVLMSYLRYKYVSTGTKGLVLSELHRRYDAGHEGDADIIIQSFDFNELHALIQSANAKPDLAPLLVTFLKRLSSNETMHNTLVSLLDMEDCAVVLKVFSESAVWPQLSVQVTDVVRRVRQMNHLHSPNKKTSMEATRVFSRLLSDSEWAKLVLAEIPCHDFLVLLRQPRSSSDLLQQDIWLLQLLSDQPSHAMTLIEGGVFNLITEWIRSGGEPAIVYTASHLLECILLHETTIPAAIHAGLCWQLVRVLHLTDFSREDSYIDQGASSKRPVKGMRAAVVRCLHRLSHDPRAAHILCNAFQMFPGSRWLDADLRDPNYCEAAAMARSDPCELLEKLTLAGRNRPDIDLYDVGGLPFLFISLSNMFTRVSAIRTLAMISFDSVTLSEPMKKRAHLLHSSDEELRDRTDYPDLLGVLVHGEPKFFAALADKTMQRAFQVASQRRTDCDHNGCPNIRGQWLSGMSELRRAVDSLLTSDEALEIITTHSASLQDPPKGDSPYRLDHLVEAMLKHAPTENGTRYVALVIIDAQTSSNPALTLVEVAEAWLNHLIVPMLTLRLENPSRSSRLNDSGSSDDTLPKQPSLHDLLLQREGYRALISDVWDGGYMQRLMLSGKQLPNIIRGIHPTKATRILPISSACPIDSTDMFWAMFQAWTDMSREAISELETDSPCHAMLLGQFDHWLVRGFRCYFEPVSNEPNTYVGRTLADRMMFSTGQRATQIKFTGNDPPSPELFRIHAAYAHVFHACGVDQICYAPG
ncbi:hypothetical protein MIND_01093300 [Mycena indigotica]|uniref:Uncharacterized protein n=1 Tax=Mycena indigotica TaxID=2126181 RepID=A0A8H6VZ23_9AGAR|nr:uncharacterized protein MIND_01093300 [Mycena indigotica]KAF7295533.1 hypothetical protein MIND_01093300 [Mycena indigotica]